ncbi:hypothetical protein ACFWOG_27630 [Kitasatospora sp. NPDC058406]|uniref:hypothetical protein n=1 Tax=Kitasatospora sp. NPDC058406 TaxID=3346483 RepID=UPI003653F65F
MSSPSVRRNGPAAHAKATLRAWGMVPEAVVRRVVAARVGSAVARCFLAADGAALVLISAADFSAVWS